MVDLRFDGLTAVVTGGGRGIGRAHCLALAARGARVVVNDLGSTVHGEATQEPAAESVAAEIEQAGGTALAVTSSITSRDGADAIVDRAIDAYGRIDILVNNAGILEATTFPAVDDEQFARQVDVHLTGSFNLCRAAWPSLATSPAGRIVMTTSAAALYGMPKQVSYAAAKMGVVGLTKSLAAIGADLGVKVNAVAPGAYTRMTEADLRDPTLRTFSRTHRGPELVSPAVIVLAHEQCPTTGEIFAVSGGRVARVFLGETRGYTAPEHTAEDLLAHWPAVMDRSSFIVPDDVAESIEYGLEQLRVAGVDAPRVRLTEFDRTGTAPGAEVTPR